MRFPKPIAVREIAAAVNAEIIGDSEQWAHGINEIHKVQPGDVTFVDIEKYYRKSLGSAATIILINKRVICPEGKTLILTEDPFALYNDLVRKYRPLLPMEQAIDPSSRIDPSAIIEPNVMIGHDVVIGAGSYIQGQSYIGSYSKIGQQVTIHAGAIIGTDAFYYQQRAGIHEQWHSGGDVIIEDHALIGAGSTINKGVSGSTIIGQGTKIDAQVHIGHGVVIGKNCIIAGQVGIGGKTILGDRVKVYGQAAISNNLHIGDDAIILGRTGVTKDLAGGKTYFGLPAIEARQKFMEMAALRRLLKK